MDYIVSRIEAAQDGHPYIYITYANLNDYKVGADRSPPFNPFGSNMMAFTSPEDMMKNLPKAMANINKAIGGGFPTDSLITSSASLRTTISILSRTPWEWSLSKLWPWP